MSLLLYLSHLLLVYQKIKDVFNNLHLCTCVYQSFEESNLLVISSEAVAGLDQKKTTIVHMYFKIEKLIRGVT